MSKTASGMRKDVGHKIWSWTLLTKSECPFAVGCGGYLTPSYAETCHEENQCRFKKEGRLRRLVEDYKSIW